MIRRPPRPPIKMMQPIALDLANSVTLLLDSDDVDSIDDQVVDVDFSQCEENKLRDGHYHIVFAHPESLISSKYGRELLLSKPYQENLVAIVVDEAHCIIEW